MDNGFEGVDETVEVLMMEEGIREFVEEYEEMESQLKGKVFADKRGREEIGEWWIERAPFVVAGAVMEVLH